ncbi:fumarate reductase subunit FrdD [Hahella sp. SMD15-11]|uniref:Fumarate reductase subunit FrdD n=1 Tax=Thermohahella caldifontis TaxID=3142973 RepID=A0AB39UTD7_9GAMM
MKWKHNEPFFWGLFGAGGVVSAFVVPALVLALGLLGPLGLSGDTLTYAHMKALVDQPLIALILWGVVALTLWHCAHRVFHGLHDLGFHPGAVARVFTYGVAALVTVVLPLYLF